MAQTSGWVLCFAGDSLEGSRTYRTKREALDAFKEAAHKYNAWQKKMFTKEELAIIHEPYKATVHASWHSVTFNKDCVCEYPDFALSLGPRGGVRCESV